MKIYWRKPYSDDSDKQGYITFSIISFSKRPWMCQSTVLSDHEAWRKGYRVENITTQWSCYLRIDLYFAVFDFDWLTKFRETKI